MFTAVFDASLKLKQTTRPRASREAVVFGRPKTSSKMPFLQHLEDLKLEQLALEHIVPALLDQGFFYKDNFLGEIVGHMVLAQVKQMHYSGVLNDGQLAGRGSGVSKRHIRGDKIAWVSGTEKWTEAINFLLKLIDKLISLCAGRLGKKVIRDRSKVMNAKDRLVDLVIRVHHESYVTLSTVSTSQEAQPGNRM